MELVKTHKPAQEAHDAPPPKHLSVTSRRIWREMVHEWDFDRAALLILEAALEARDRMTQAQALIERDGLIITDPQGTRANPAVGIEKDARAGLLRCRRQLNLDIEPTSGIIGRPPRNGFAR